MVPPPDVSGPAAAVISAGLLIALIAFVVRSRRSTADLESPLTAALAPDWMPGEPEMFATVVTSGFPGIGLLLSSGLHLIVAVGTPLLPYLFHDQLRFDLRKYDVKIVEFRVPQPLLYTAGERKNLSRPEIRILAQASEQRSGRRARPADGRGRIPFRVPVSDRNKGRAVILQPDQPPEVPMTMPQPLPRTFLWAQAPAPTEESRLVGSAAQRPPEPPRFVLPPVTPILQPPNRELTVAELQIASGPILTFRNPQLPMMPANITPVGAAGADGAFGELPATALPGGSPMNLIALLPNPAAALSSYLLDTGNRLAEPGGEGEGGGMTSGISSETPRAGTHADLLAAAAAPATTPATAGPDPAPASAVIAPSSGSLGVVVVRPAGDETGLEGSDVLTGEPVYTVFFEVPGSPRRWILQYCVPHSEAVSFVQTSENRIQILPRRTVQPPFPLDRIPLDLSPFQGTSTRRLVIYAILDERGEMRNARVVRGTGREADTVALATLQRWAFRPATRGDAPVAVEALFGIPLD